MKHPLKKAMLAITLLAILVISQSVSAAPLHPAIGGPVSQFVYDNFDDNYTDPAHWGIEQLGGPTVSEVNQRLEITLPANSTGTEFKAWYLSACQLRGDYDIQVDYEALNWPDANGVRIGLADDHVNMQRISSRGQPYDISGGPDLYLTTFDVASHTEGITPTSGYSGKLRLTRVGNILSSYYFANGAWAFDASYADPAYAQDTYFYIGSFSGTPVFAGQEVKIAFDNLMINQGELVCPVNGVTIDQASGQADPTSSSPVLFTVIFSEPVTGFGDAAADVVLSGTAGATTVTVTEAAPNDGTTYTVAVSGMTASGTVIASIPAGAAVDVRNNANAASTSSDSTVTFNLPATGQITPITATCSQFAAGTALDLNSVIYSVYNNIKGRNDRVSWVTPSDFYYYSKVIAPLASFNIKVVQLGNIYGWPFLFALQGTVYDADCKAFTSRYTNANNSIYTDFKVTNATPGAVYYVRIRYLALSVLGSAVPRPFPSVPWSATTVINDAFLLRSSIDNLTFRP